MAGVIWELLDCPFIFIDIIAEADLGIDIIAKQINIALIFRTPIE